VSRKDQRLEPQCDALLADGCERVFKVKISSREADRKALREAFDYCREGTSWWWRDWIGWGGPCAS
jgi:DNA invertase Pin-like site-specific DNA recombinase